MASLWYCNVGHGRGEIADAVATQIRTIESYSCFDPFTNAPADALAERIAELSPVDDARVFFTGSGSEAVDSAMKLARLTQLLAGHPERQLIISRERGYHGTNYGGTSAQGLPLNKVGYGELLADVVQVPSDDIEALSVLMAQHSGRIAAVLTEPVQGAAGVYTPTDGYLETARQLCDQHGALLIFDEVITGFGRLGTWFAVAALRRHARPHHVRQGRDVGLPAARRRDRRSVRCGPRSNPTTRSSSVTATRTPVTHRRVRRLWPTSTSSSGRVWSARSTASGADSASGLRALAADGVVDHVRGEGAIYGAALRPDQDATAIRDRMHQLGVVTRAIGTDTLTFCPPLVITDDQIDRVVDAVATACPPARCSKADGENPHDRQRTRHRPVSRRTALQPVRPGLPRRPVPVLRPPARPRHRRT